MGMYLDCRVALSSTEGVLSGTGGCVSDLSGSRRSLGEWATKSRCTEELMDSLWT